MWPTPFADGPAPSGVVAIAGDASFVSAAGVVLGAVEAGSAESACMGAAVTAEWPVASPAIGPGAPEAIISLAASLGAVPTEEGPVAADDSLSAGSLVFEVCVPSTVCVSAVAPPEAPLWGPATDETAA